MSSRDMGALLDRSARSENVYFQLTDFWEYSAAFDVTGLSGILAAHPQLCERRSLKVERVYMGENAGVDMEVLAFTFEPLFGVSVPTLEMRCPEQGAKEWSFRISPTTFLDPPENSDIPFNVKALRAQFDSEPQLSLGWRGGVLGPVFRESTVVEFFEGARTGDVFKVAGVLDSGENFEAQFNLAEVREFLDSEPFCKT